MEKLESQVLRADPICFALKYNLWKIPVNPKDFHADWLSLAGQGRNLVLLAPKDFAKSTVFSFILPIWLICWNPDIRIILASDTHTQAVRRTRAVKNELASNRLLQRDFGGIFQPRRGEGLWSDEEFVIAQRINKSLPDSTLRALGVRDAIEGARADWIIGDDICSLENMGTADRRKKVSDWFFSPLLGCREKWTPVQLVGTRKHWGDLYSDLQKLHGYQVPSEWERADYLDAQGQFCSMWPELWPAWRLQSLMEESPSAYARDKRNQPMNPEDSPFPEEWLDAAKREGYEIVFKPARELGLEYVVQAWDVAGQTDKEKAEIKATAYYSCCTIGRARDGKIVIADIWRKRGVTPSQWVRQVQTQFMKHKPDVVVVETNAQQSYFKAHAEEQTFIPIIGHNTTPTHKRLLKNREAGLSLRLERGQYVFPYGPDTKTRKEIDNLSMELNQFGTTERSDAVMSLFMADCYLRGNQRSGKISGTTGGSTSEEANHGGKAFPSIQGPDPWSQSDSERPY